jgi:methionyl-tRNA formyltransferase
MQKMQAPIRTVFMGTPDFAVPTLRALAEYSASGGIWPAGLDLAGVVTRPDKPAGRGKHVVISPVKRYALERGLPVFQPGPLRRPEAMALLQTLASELIVVAAFGQILPPEVLRLPRFGCLNVHASLLPRWRGASPINAAILAGDDETGVTIMLMGEGLDTGPVLEQTATPIGPDETAGQLSDRLAALGAETFVRTLPRWLSGAIVPRPQDEAAATMTRPLRKEDGLLDWTRPASDLVHVVRAYTPWPGAHTIFEGRQLKVLQARPVPLDPGELPPGQCFLREPDHALCCTCGQGALALEMIQLEGRRALPAADVLRGRPSLANATLGTQTNS